VVVEKLKWKTIKSCLGPGEVVESRECDCQNNRTDIAICVWTRGRAGARERSDYMSMTCEDVAARVVASGRLSSWWRGCSGTVPAKCRSLLRIVSPAELSAQSCSPQALENHCDFGPTVYTVRSCWLNWDLTFTRRWLWRMPSSRI
jgi:hypothetical protein